MAGNIVKWWRQFKQYKQFSALQECTTDTEELIYQASSTCSAPPDILLSNKEPSISIMSQSAPAPELLPQQSKPVKVVKVKEHHSVKTEKMSQEQLERLQKRHSIATTRHLEAQEANRVQVEELTCDVSVEDPTKKPQPIQFSFTLYDLDGHGKITKDDIAGIVSTIYDSIGKTVVVPHYGKKTINVKLTVSPDSKNQQQLQQKQLQQQLTTNGNVTHSRVSKKLQLTPRRRCRQRVPISDDDEDDDENGSRSSSDNIMAHQKLHNEIHSATTNDLNDKNNLYESINNLKCCNQPQTIDNLLMTKNNKNIEIYKNCQPHHSPERLHIDENQHQKQIKKKILRKSRSRRHRASDAPVARVRSLSVGNENKWRHQHQDNKAQDFVTAKDCHLNNTNNTNLRRDELIEIIRESMEKNRLCFQGNRKTENVPNGRQRSNTINGKMNHCTAGEGDQQHLCAFDSFLHATICSNLHGNSPVDASKIKMNNRNRMKQLNHSVPAPGLKLKTSVLNQLNPILSPEQKLTRKLNDVEKWLLERDPTTHCYKIDESKIRTKEDKNLLNPIVIDKLSTQATSTPKKVFNKEVLITKKSKPIGHQSKHQKEVINSTKNQIILEYSNVPVPVTGDASECENLISMSDDESSLHQAPTAILINSNSNEKTEAPENGSNASESTSKSSFRFVHIHHHFYHFENGTEC